MAMPENPPQDIRRDIRIVGRHNVSVHQDAEVRRNLTVGGDTTVAGDLQVTGLLSGGGVVEHDWTRDGWDPFETKMITADGAQAFTTSVVNGAGVVTSTSAADSQHRVAYLREGTEWLNSEITSLILPPSADFDGTNAQQGHIHRAVEISPGVWAAVVVWTSVIAFGYGYMHVRLMQWNGTTLQQGNVADEFGTDDYDFVARRLAILSKSRRTAFGLWFNEHQVYPGHLYGITADDTITINSADSTFDETDIDVNGAEPQTALLQVIDPTDTDAVAWGVDTGTIVATNRAKDVAPFWLTTRVTSVDSDTVLVEMKRDRPEDGRSDWSDPRVQREEISAGGSTPTMPNVAGRCGLWTGHFRESMSGSWGNATFRQVPGG